MSNQTPLAQGNTWCYGRGDEYHKFTKKKKLPSELHEFQIIEPNKRKFNNYFNLILSSLPTVLSELHSQ